MLKGQKKGEPIDIVGQKFGKLTVVALVGRGARKRYMWECICECGGKKVVAQDLLRAGRTKSCGCLLDYARSVHNKFPDRELALYNLLYFSMKKRHNIKSTEKIISKECFISLSKEACFYCGAVGTHSKKDIRKDSRHKGSKTVVVSNTVIKYNGIDRVDNSKWYVDGNCVSCCRHCNTAKNTLTLSEFKGLIRRIYANWASL